MAALTRQDVVEVAEADRAVVSKLLLYLFSFYRFSTFNLLSVNLSVNSDV
jgi:hypothetical protein